MRGRLAAALSELPGSDEAQPRAIAPGVGEQPGG